MLAARRSVYVALVVLSLAVRLAFLAAEPHPYAESGLAADSGEVARQIDQYGRWFTSNLLALNLIGRLQDERHRLIDPADVDFRAVDAHPQLQPEVLQPVGEAVLVAGLWWVIGSERWIALQLLSIAIDSAMVLVVLWIGLRLFNRRRAALVGAFLYAVYPPIAAIASIPHLDIWGIDFTLATVALLLRARDARAPLRWLVLAGVVAGLGAYFRPGLLLLAPMIALATLFELPWRRALRLALVPTLVAALMLVPWTIRNEKVFHRFIPTRIGTGQNLWEGLGEMHNSFGAVLNDEVTGREVHARHPRLVYGTPAYDDVLMSWAKKAIREHPGFYLQLIGHRLVNSTVLLRNTEWAGEVQTPSQAGLSLPTYLIQRPGDLLALALEPLLFLISLATVILTRRRFAAGHLVGVAIIAATLLPYLFLHVEPRYLLPASFVYLLWAGLAVDLLLDRRRASPEPDLTCAASAA